MLDKFWRRAFMSRKYPSEYGSVAQACDAGSMRCSWEVSVSREHPSEHG